MALQKKLAFIDTETSGLNPSIHELLEFAVVFDDGGEVDFKIKPEHIETASPRALEVNGYTPEAWGGAVTQQEAARRIAELLNDTWVAGQNVKFDIAFLEALSKKTGVEIKTRYGLDTVTLSFEHLKHLGLKSLSLKTVCEFLGIPPEPDVHRAVNGARAAKQVFDTLLRASALKRYWWGLKSGTPETATYRALPKIGVHVAAMSAFVYCLPRDPFLFFVTGMAAFIGVGYFLDKVVPTVKGVEELDARVRSPTIAARGSRK